MKKQALGPGDIFAQLLDRIIRDDGGAGNHGQLRVRLAHPIAPIAELECAWRRLGEQAWPVGGRFTHTLRGRHLVMAGPARLRLEFADDIDRSADQCLREGTGEALVQLTLITNPQNPGLILTWQHILCDARGATGILVALKELAAGKPLNEPWWRPDYRGIPGMPRLARERGRQARAALALMRPHRLARILRPLMIAGRSPSPANRALPLARFTSTFDAHENATITERQRAASGRLAETPFFIACVAAALEDLVGIGGDVLFPLAIDLRSPGDRHLFANRHGYGFLRIPAGLASRDLVAAAAHAKKEQRDWIAADGALRMASSMSWFAHVPHRLARAELGVNKPGVAASCLFANTGTSAVPDVLFGAPVIGVDHVASLPGTPGVGVLFHRDTRGLVIDCLACGHAVTRLPPARLAARIRWQMLERPLK